MEHPLEKRLRFYQKQTASLTARIDELKSTWSYRISAPIRLVERAVRSARKRPIAENLARARSHFLRAVHGWSDKTVSPYYEWIEEFDTLRADDVELIEFDIVQLPLHPRIAVIIMPGPGSIETTRASLAAQIYADFDVVAPAATVSSRGSVNTQIVEHASGGSAAEFFNAALAQVAADFCIAIDAGDVLSPHALYLYARAINDNKDAELIFGDEDDLTLFGLRTHPFFKPGWNSQLALAFDYVGRTALYRTQWLRASRGASAAAGRVWRWDLLQRLTGRRPGGAHVVRVPFVVLHRSQASTRVEFAELEAGKRIVGEALSRAGQSAAIAIDPRGWLSIAPAAPPRLPQVSIIIPTRDRHDLLKQTVDGLLSRTTYPNFDLTIVDNLSRDPRTLAYLESLSDHPRVSIVRYPERFNYAALHNFVIPKTHGELIAFLNNDVDVMRPDWLERMVAFAIRPDVGIAGAKLYYPNDTVQHAGVVVDAHHGANHVYVGYRRFDAGPRGLLMVSRDVAAVTAACMVLRRSVFDESGGFDEAFAVDFNDIDLCLKVRQCGYRVVWVADAELHHYESATRGEKRRGFERERRYEQELSIFRERWATGVTDDQFFNPNLGRNAANAGLAFPPRTILPWREWRGEGRGGGSVAPKLDSGIALYGFFHTANGIGQVARNMAETLGATTIPFSCHLVPHQPQSANQVDFPCSTGVVSNYDTSLAMLSAGDLITIEADDALFLRGKHRIGFWPWELPVFPAIWAPALGLVDEIWVPSRFVAGSLADATNKPVHLVPPSVRAATLEKKVARELLKISQDAFVFLTTFGAGSSIARKNPEAVIRAFLDAFPSRDRDGPVLVVKYRRSSGATDWDRAIRKLVRWHERIALIDRVLSSSEMAALTCAADVFVSLHRSEGFGLNIAEAMAAGRLAIATNFSGNTDFMNAENSVLVPYQMRAVGPAEYVHGAGQWWAEPDHDAAVEALRAAVGDTATTARLAEHARRDFASKYSPVAAGQTLTSTLMPQGRWRTAAVDRG